MTSILVDATMLIMTRIKLRPLGRKMNAVNIADILLRDGTKC